MRNRRRLLLLTLALLLCHLLAGCNLWSGSSKGAGPIDGKAVLVMLPFATEMAVMDPTTYRVTHRIKLGRFVTDYAFTPNGTVYIPLSENPGDKEVFVGVLDRQTGTLKRVKSPVAAIDYAVATADGTVFIRSGTTRGDDQFLLVMDSKTDTVIGTVPLPGDIRRMTVYNDSSVLVPVAGPSGPGGNVYVVDRNLKVSAPLFPFELEPWAPATIRLKPNSTIAYFMYNGFAPNDTDRRAELVPTLSDPRLVEAHINVWDLKEHKMLRRIFLPVPSAQNMLLGPDGRLYVGHIDMTHKGPVKQISVVEPDTGAVSTLETVNNPYSLQIRGDRLYVGSDTTTSLDVFHLPDLTRIKRVTLPDRPLLSTIALPE